MQTGNVRPDRSWLSRTLGGLGLLLVLALSAPPGAVQEIDEESMARVRVYPAALRAGCGMDHGVVASLSPGEKLAVLEQLEGWYRVRRVASGVEGCVREGTVEMVTVPEPEAVPVAAPGTGLLWQVERGAAKGYLLGSIHVSRQDFYPLPAPVEAAYEEATVVVFEADLAELDGMELAARALARGTLPEGERLEELLPERTYAALVRRAGEIGLPIAGLDELQPWLAALTVMHLELQHAGFHAAWGIDQHLHQRARRDGKRTAFLEDAAFQLDLFADMPEEQSVAFIEHSLGQSELLRRLIDELLAAWSAGDALAFEKLLEANASYDLDLHERFLTDRNRAWVEPLEALLAEDSPALVVVGAAHLVGDGSVVELLRQRGYRVVPIAPEAAGVEPHLPEAHVSRGPQRQAVACLLGSLGLDRCPLG